MAARDTALKVRIKDITNGELKKGKSEWESFLVTPFNEEVARVRVLATVVSRFKSDDGKYGNLTLDDATDTITSRVFDDNVQLIEGAEDGDIVDVIGRVREYEGERYINAESVSKIVDPNWELVRKLELALKIKRAGGDVEAPDESVEEEVVGENPKSVVIDLIEKLGEGDGVKYVRLVDETELSEKKLEEILTELMEEGEIYEPKIGKFKRV
ncbi:MAG: OB-fold nucleic acid binding domain-containing protein [Candidatus Hydrothermarchaeaceae archaeon]